MIPEETWQLIRRWFALILAFVALGAAGGFLLLPLASGGASKYDSSVTLGVAHYVSPGGEVRFGSRTGEGVVVSDYTAALADYAKTPQFLSKLNERLGGATSVASELDLPRKVKVVADKGLFYITIRATTRTKEEADLLAQKAAEVIQERAEDEETGVVQSLMTSMNSQRVELLTRWTTLSADRDEILAGIDLTPTEVVQIWAGLPTTGTTDSTDDAALQTRFRVLLENLAKVAANPDLILINAQMDALEDQLGAVAKSQESLSIDLLRWSDPVFVLDPAVTVLTEEGSVLRKRDMLAMGGGAGVVLGWLAANIAEQIRPGRKPGKGKSESDAD